MVRNDVADVAILAIPAADLLGGSNDTGPHRSCGSLRNGLPLKGRLTPCCKLLIHLVDHLLDMAWVHVATKLGPYASRMHGCSAYATLPVPLVEGNGKKDVRCFRTAICNEEVIGRPFKVGILEVDVGEAVTRRRQIDQPSSARISDAIRLTRTKWPR